MSSPAEIARWFGDWSPRSGRWPVAALADVLYRRYGGAERESLESIGQSYGVGPGAVRQQEAVALRVLRHPSRRSALLAAAGDCPPRLWWAIFGTTLPQEEAIRRDE